MMGLSDSAGLELSKELRLRSATSTYVLFSVLFGIFMVLPLLISGLRDPSAWKVTALFGGVLAIFLFHFYRLEVVVSNGIITYRTLFILRRSRHMADIVESWVGRNPGARDTRPMLFIRTRYSETPLGINLKPYRREDIRQLLNMPELEMRHSHHVT